MVKSNVKVDSEKMESKIKERLESIKNEGEETVKKKPSDGSNKPATKSKAGTNGLVSWVMYGKRKYILGAIGLFLVFLFIQLKYIYNVWFDPDELDVYSIGYEMAKGKILYKDIPSQHMPWTYFFSCFFYFLGAHTATLQRLCFYIMFAAFWTYFVFAYRRYVNKWILIITPFVYHAILQHIDFATQILSEHLCVIGAQIFILEFLMFLKKRDISIASCIRMSIAVVFTFGTAFLMVFALFFLGLGVIGMEIKWRIESGQSRGEWWGMMFKRYLKLAAFMAIPWVLMVIYMLATHSFHDFGFCAYTINRLYYPQYMNGIGGGIFSTLVTGITAPCSYALNLLATDITVLFVFKAFMFVSVIYFSYRLARKYGIIAGAAVYMFAFSFGTRGLFNYHGVPFIGTAALLSSFVLIKYMFKNKDNFIKESMAKRCATCVIIGIMGLAFFSDFQMSVGFISGEAFNSYKADTDVLAAVIDEEDRVWQTNVCDTISYTAQRVTDGPSVSTPWMWDSVGKKDIEEFIKNPTKVAIFQLGYETWGHKMADYAPEAYYFIVNNYKLIPTSTQIWARNDYYEEACRRLGVDPDSVKDLGVSVSPFTVDESELPGKTAADRKEALKRQEEGITEPEAEPEEEEETQEEDKQKKEDKEDKDEKDKKESEEEDTEAATEESTDEEASDDKEAPAEGPGAVIVSPNEGGVVYLDPDGNVITENTPGAVQAPDGSWVLPDDSDGPGM